MELGVGGMVLCVDVLTAGTLRRLGFGVVRKAFHAVGT